MSEERSVFQKIGDAVTDYAPGLAGILALVPGVGTVPAAALGAVAALGRSLGLGSAARPEDVLQAISADPEIRLKAMVAENDFAVKMGQRDLDKLKAELADVQSARSRQVESEKATGKRDYNLYILAWVIMGGFLGIILAMIIGQYFYGKTLQNDPLLMLLMGSLSTNAGMVVGYFFGSSKSSADKNDQIGQLRKQIGNLLN